MEIKDKVAIVSGGASGLGQATAEALSAAGLKVAIFDLNREAGEQLVSKLGEERTLFAKVNVADGDSVQQGIDLAVERFGAIHLCVNCAGIAPAKKILDRDSQAMPLEDFSKVIEVNLIGSFNLARLVAQQFAKNEPMGEAKERGLIVNTASVAAYEGQVGQCAYAASKAGIVGLGLPMARDLAALGIRVNTIAPGIMGTPMLLAMPEQVQESLIANVQFPKRLGLPDEFARLVIHMAENAYLNGETVRLDGALRMQPR